MEEVWKPVPQCLGYEASSMGRVRGPRGDQHAAEVDGERVPMMTATDVGATVRGWIAKRPSVSLVAEIRRDEWAAANLIPTISGATAATDPAR